MSAVRFSLSVLSAAALLCAALFSACSEQKAPPAAASAQAQEQSSREPREAPAQRLIFAGEGVTLINPLLNAHDELPGLIFAGLLKYDAEGRPVPELCESMEVSADGLTYTFVLRKGLLWHDGQAVTADDVVFTYQTMISPQAALSPVQSNYLDIKEVYARDARTAVIVLQQPNAAMPGYFTLGLVPRHCLEGEDLYTTPFNHEPVGCGRYILKSWDVQGGYITLQANAAWHEGQPQLETIIYCTVAAESAKSAMLAAGEADLAWLNAGYAGTFRGLEGFASIDFKTADLRAVSFDFHTAFVQRNRDSLALLNLAVDKETLVQGVLHGHGQAAGGILQLNPVYPTRPQPGWDYDPDEFARRMAELGWSRGEDGIYQRGGERFAFTLQVREYEEERVDLAYVTAAMLRRAGVEMEVVPVPHFDFTAGFNAFLYGNAAQFDPDGWYSTLHSAGSDNTTAYADARVDALLEQGRRTADPKERGEIYQALEEAWAAAPGMLPLVYLEGCYVAREGLQGPDTRRLLGHHASGVFWNVETWHWAGTAESEAGD